MRKPASEILEGDVIDVAGAELHEDISGLWFKITAESVDEDDGKIYVHDQHTDSDVWFDPEEEVVVTFSEGQAV